MNVKKLEIEAILVVMIAPTVAWFISFVVSSYQSQAEVSNLRQDIIEIKQDVKEIRKYELEHR